MPSGGTASAPTLGGGCQTEAGIMFQPRSEPTRKYKRFASVSEAEWPRFLQRMTTTPLEDISVSKQSGFILTFLSEVNPDPEPPPI